MFTLLMVAKILGTLSLGKTKGVEKIPVSEPVQSLFLHAKEPSKLDGTKHFINLHGVCGQGGIQSSCNGYQLMSGALGRDH